MPQRLIIKTILCLTLIFLGTAEVFKLCTSKMSVHAGFYQDNVGYETVGYVRSVVECATLCHADIECQSAVYREDKTCHLIESANNIGKGFNNSQFIADFLLQPAIEICPFSCSGDSVCMLDCSNTAVTPEAICINLSGPEDGCNFSPITQVKEYYLSGLDETSSANDHVYFGVTFTKLHESTALRIKFRGTLRGGFGGPQSFGFWEIKFNGSSCNTPGKIESAHYNDEPDASHHRASGIHGICEGLTIGSVEITLNAILYNSAIFQVGYLTEASRLYVEEFKQAGDVLKSSCPSLSSFNIKEYVFSLYSNGHNNLVPYWNTTYKKMEDNTSLKINIDLVITMSTSSSACAMWFVLIDEQDCQPEPFGKTLTYFNGASNIANEQRSVEVEGYCDDIPAGYLDVSLYVGSCTGTGKSPSGVSTGWSGFTQRMIIEEYRKESNINSVMASNGKTLYRLPQMNAVTFSVFNLDKGTDNGVVWNLGNYHKLYKNSGLRLSLSGGARAENTNRCCRFFFMVNNADCKTPGPIEGIISLSVGINIHRPILIEGICEKVPAGDVELSVHVGLCKDQTIVGNCHFGWRSHDHVMASEVYAEREILYF